MKKLTITVPSYAALALERLNASGYGAWVVGGCVRDTLMGRTPGDWDICTAALPDQTRQLFETDFHVIDTGLQHGTVTVVVEGQPLEITTCRTEGAYSDNRRPDSVSFVSDVRTDLARRDFTINAMAYNRTDGLLDLFDGQSDLSAGLIRCVGQAEKRFGEDSLRILRALRFAAVLDFQIESKTAVAAHKMAGLLKNISVERVFIELKKLLTADSCPRIVSEFGDVIALAAGSPPRELITTSGDAAVAFCLAFENAPAVLTRLKAPRSLIASAAALQAARPPQSLPEALSLMGQTDREDHRRLTEYFNAQGISTELLQAAFTSGIPCRISQLDISGRDLISLGISPGPALGQVLNALLDAVINGRLINQKPALLAAAEQLTGLRSAPDAPNSQL